MTAARDAIERTLRTMHQIENSLDLIPAEKVAATDSLMAPGVREWTNGADSGDRNAGREREAWVFNAFSDYHREFKQVLIDPPNAAITWRMTGTIVDTGEDYALDGASVFRFDSDSRIDEVRVFFGT